ncbi:Molybdopterin synthase sulfur carrier subunit [Tepidimonas thermarum]|uniref:Molybdopterin synthase sulfur carrier subunit n=1 Tax=Tepidimonas thermarum TaxID=335431 RepID=A0A554X953_9BURK|nr:molybdopterin converting factor subunit 1 [Tepidimonas thermarum]TSE32360.1 Molybdopterin synthase sulfur carrier subunit [Tepidimonas thermarum]
MNVTLRFFAAIREAVGTDALTLQTSAATLGALRDELIARGGAWAQVLARGRALRMAVDQVMADESTPLHEGAEVAFFPPVTGG